MAPTPHAVLWWGVTSMDGMGSTQAIPLLYGKVYEHFLYTWEKFLGETILSNCLHFTSFVIKLFSNLWWWEMLWDSKFSPYTCCLWEYIYIYIYISVSLIIIPLTIVIAWTSQSHKIPPCWKMRVLKTVSRKPCLFSNNPIPKQPKWPTKTPYTALRRTLLLPGSKVGENWGCRKNCYTWKTLQKRLSIWNKRKKVNSQRRG